MFSSQNSQVSGAAADPYFNQTTLLLHGDGTNGAQNNTFLDSSTNNFTITRNGNTTQGTFTPFSQAAGYWANNFDGTGDYLIAASNAAFAYGTGDFTFECWINPTIAHNGYILDHGTSGNTGTIELSGDSKIIYYNTSSGVIQTASSVVAIGAWTHVAVVRLSGTTKIYINGVSSASGADTFNYPTQRVVVGAYSASLIYNFNGYISNLRIVKGTAVYTANFTPSTVPLTAITNTSLLTCQSSRFVDNSTNNFTLTANGNVAVQPFSPFAPTSAYSTAVNGGSGYFDGTGDYLTAAANSAFQFGTGDLTIEYWYYPTAFGTNTSIDMGYTNTGSYVIQNGSDGKPYFYSGTTGTVFTASTGYILNTWNHLAVTRSGTTLSMFINGTRVGTATNSTNFNANFALGVGGSPTHTTVYEVVGYISNARLVKGTAVYDPTQTTLTVPTAPFTNITNTSLLTNFTNAGIFDNAIKNNLETIGNAQISTSVVKFGTGSMAFDGTGDYLSIPSTLQLTFGTGDFTIEFWVNYASASGSYIFYDGRGTSISQTGMCFYITSSTLYAQRGTTALVTATAPTANVWHHIAFTRAGSSNKLFVDGTQVGTTATDSTNFSTAYSVGIGAPLDSTYTASYALNGYIDDLRITKGVARYTAAFTSPTAAFSNQ